MKQDHDRIKSLLTEAVTLLCRNSLVYSTELAVEALIGITVDKQDVMLVSIRETFESAERLGGSPSASGNQQHETYSVQRARRSVQRELDQSQDEPISLDDDSQDPSDSIGPPEKMARYMYEGDQEDSVHSESNPPLQQKYPGSSDDNGDMSGTYQVKQEPLDPDPHVGPSHSEAEQDTNDDQKPDLSSLAMPLPGSIPGYEGWPNAQDSDMYAQNAPPPFGTDSQTFTPSSLPSETDFTPSPSAAQGSATSGTPQSPYVSYHQYPAPATISMYVKPRPGSHMVHRRKSHKAAMPSYSGVTKSTTLHGQTAGGTPQFTAAQSFPCPVCQRHFKNRSKAKRHFASVHEDKRGWMCGKCDATFSRQDNTLAHLRGVHKCDAELAHQLCVKANK